MRILRLRRGILLCTLAVCLGCSAQTTERGDDSIQPSSSLPKTTPWDLKALSKAPSVKWLNQKGKIRSLIYQGLPYKGKPTSVFAYYATPGSLSGDPSKDKDLPAVVLVHGGGGSASMKWVELWAERGYAAISMDLAGRGKDIKVEELKTITEDPLFDAPVKRLVDGGPDQTDEVKFGQVDAPVGDQWTYHAVANVILAHSLVQSFQEVDSDRTAIEGSSWGGYVTLIAASLDNRFKAAVNEFGSGFLHENSYWKEWFDEKMTAEQRDRWVQLWDPSMYVRSAVMPILFHTGVTDPYYPIDSFAKTYQLVKGPRYLCIFSALLHRTYYNAEVGIFIDQHLKGGTPLPKVTKVKLTDGQVFAEVVTKTKLIDAGLLYTTDNGTIGTREWKTNPARIDGNRITAEAPPRDATIWFFVVADERKAVVSSEPVFADKTI